MKPDHFLASHSLFTRQELGAALAGRSPATLDAHLARWQRQERIVRVKNGLYLRRDLEVQGARVIRYCRKVKAFGHATHRKIKRFARPKGVGQGVFGLPIVKKQILVQERVGLVSVFRHEIIQASF